MSRVVPADDKQQKSHTETATKPQNKNATKLAQSRQTLFYTSHTDIGRSAIFCRISAFRCVVSTSWRCNVQSNCSLFSQLINSGEMKLMIDSPRLMIDFSKLSQ